MACVEHPVSTQENSPLHTLLAEVRMKGHTDSFMDSMPLQSFTLGSVHCDKMNYSVIKSKDVWDQNKAASQQCHC